MAVVVECYIDLLVPTPAQEQAAYLEALPDSSLALALEGFVVRGTWARVSNVCPPTDDEILVVRYIETHLSVYGEHHLDTCVIFDPETKRIVQMGRHLTRQVRGSQALRTIQTAKAA